ncbi:hypothetical protein MMC20_005956 [Loxospora ochrophaea]|nr:hypothetical protein [Loxospora ochrophaea]
MAANTEEGELTFDDGQKAYTKTWKPSTEPAAIILFVHGFSDHINNYDDFFPLLTEQNILVHAFDQRGWGRSVQKKSDKGLTGPTSQVLRDISTFISAHLPSAKPVFLMGHSMGGQEVLQFASKGPADIRKQITGYILSAPFIALHPSSVPNRLTVIVGRLAGKVLPKWQLVQKLDPKFLTRDQKVAQGYVDDELVHDTGTLEGLAGMLERAEELDTGKVEVQDGDSVRIWCGHGNGDRVTSHEASKRFMDRCKVKDKEFKTYEGWYHCLHAEPGGDKETFADDIAKWVLFRAEPENDASKQTKSKL